MNGADWYDVRHRRLMITTDGTVKEEESLSLAVCRCSKLQRDVTILARSSRQMYQTVRILSRVRVSARPSNFLIHEKHTKTVQKTDPHASCVC